MILLVKSLFVHTLYGDEPYDIDSFFSRDAKGRL